MEEYIKKSEVLGILQTMPPDLQYEYIAELDGIWLDKEDQGGKIMHFAESKNERSRR